MNHNLRSEDKRPLQVAAQFQDTRQDEAVDRASYEPPRLTPLGSLHHLLLAPKSQNLADLPGDTPSNKRP